MERMTEQSKRVTAYGIIVLGGLLVFCVYAAAGRHFWGLEYPMNSFLFIPKDRFMDFFHVNALSAGNRPYQEGASYPPFALFCAFFVSKLIPNSSDIDPFFIRDHEKMGITVLHVMYLLFAVLMSSGLVRFFFMNREEKKESLAKGKLKNIVLPIVLLLGSVFFSAPLLYAYDRGNYLIICVLFLFLFAFLYQKHPVLAALSLAVASALKIYPLVLFLIFLLDRKWKSLFIGLFAGGAATVLTFLCFEGTFIENCKGFVWNLLNFTGGRPMTHDYYFRGAVGIRSLLAAPFLLVNNRIPEWLNISAVGLIAGVIILVVVVFMCFREKRYERQIYYLSLFMILFPTPSYYYNITYLVPPICLLLLKKEKVEWYIPVLSALMMIPKNYMYISPFFYDVHVAVSVGHFLDPLLMCMVLFFECRRLVEIGGVDKIGDGDI